MFSTQFMSLVEAVLLADAYVMRYADRSAFDAYVMPINAELGAGQFLHFVCK
jgi:hypothetical protein